VFLDLLVIVVPVLVWRNGVADQALRHLPLLLASGTPRPGLERVPDGKAPGPTHPPIVRAGRPFTLRTVDARCHSETPVRASTCLAAKTGPRRSRSQHRQNNAPLDGDAPTSRAERCRPW
jgi:hypothetical protein